MSNIVISVPDVNAILQGLPANGFNQIIVERSSTGASGAYSEITADTDMAASVTGTIAGPFAVGMLTIELRVDRGSVQTCTIYNSSPVDIDSVILAVNNQIGGVVASSTSGRLTISTTEVGTGAVLEVVGGTALPLLGMIAGQVSTGKAARVALIADRTSYIFSDGAGASSDFYRIRYYNSFTLATSSQSNPIGSSTADVAPKRYADVTSSRGLTIIRGTTYVFRQSFWEDVDAVIPVVPANASRYPSYQIVDVNGQVVSAGVATQDGASGNYRVEFFAAPDAAISGDDRRWRIEWLMISATNRQIEKVVEFDVRDTDITASETQELKLLAMPLQPFHLPLRLDRRPFRLSLTVQDSVSGTKIVTDATFPTAPGVPTLQEVVDGDTFVYFYDIQTNLLKEGVTYAAMWSVQDTVASVSDYTWQTIEVPAVSLLPMMTSLRMVIDKYQKRRGSKQAYNDSDLYEYIKQGANMLNSWHPLTSYGVGNVPGQLQSYLLLLAAVWGLNAQHLLETDLQFNFSGMQSSIDYDHTGHLESAISRVLEFIRDHLTPAKHALFVRSQATGVVAVRPYRYTGLNNFVWRMSNNTNFGGASYLQVLSNFGLLS